MASTIKSIPCILYARDTSDRQHAARALANIGKCQNIPYEELSSYSELLAHGYHMMNGSAITTEELDEAYQKHYRDNFCGIALKNALSIRTCTEFYMEDCDKAFCLLCDFGNPMNEDRRKKESIILSALSLRIIDTTDIANFGGAAKIFTSWTAVCGKEPCGICPVIRLHYHIYCALNYILMTYTASSVLAEEIALSFNQIYFNEFQKYAQLYGKDVNEQAECFYETVYNVFYNPCSESRETVLKLLDELKRASLVSSSKKAASKSVKPKNPKTASDNKKEISAAEADIPLKELPKDLSENINRHLSQDKTGEQQPKNTIVPPLPESLSKRIKQKKAASSAASVNAGAKKPVEKEQPVEKITEPGNKKDTPAAQPEKKPDTLNTDVPDASTDIKMCLSHPYLTVLNCSSLIVLNHFTVATFEYHTNMTDIIAAEVVNYLGIYGLLFAVPRKNSYFFAALSYVMTGAVARLFSRNITVVTTNVAALVHYLQRYDIVSKCRLFALDTAAQILNPQENQNPAYTSVPELYVKYCMPAAEKEEKENAINAYFKDKLPLELYFDLWECMVRTMTKDQRRTLTFWTDFEHTLSKTFDILSVNVLSPYFKKENFGQYTFYYDNIPAGTISLSTASDSSSYYKLFCSVCVELYRNQCMHRFGVTVISVTEKQFLCSFIYGNRSDFIDILWNICMRSYNRIYKTACPDITIDVY